MSYSATPIAAPRPGWVPGSIVPGPMSLGPRRRIPMAAGAIQVDPTPVPSSRMPDGAAAYAAVPTTATKAAPAEAGHGRSERVLPGLMAATLVIPVGMLVAATVWELGFVASLSSFLVAIGAVWAYTRAAGAAPRKGALPLVFVIGLGVVASFLACLAIDLNAIYGAVGAGSGRVAFITDNLFSVTFLRPYLFEALLFAAFGALGVGRIVIGLAAAHRAA